MTMHGRSRIHRVLGPVAATVLAASLLTVGTAAGESGDPLLADYASTFGAPGGYCRRRPRRRPAGPAGARDRRRRPADHARHPTADRVDQQVLHRGRRAAARRRREGATRPAGRRAGPRVAPRRPAGRFDHGAAPAQPHLRPHARVVRRVALPAPSTPAEVVSALDGAGLAAAPGAGFSYYNANYALAARIVELVSGRPFDRYLAEELFTPLGMTATTSTGRCEAEVPDPRVRRRVRRADPRRRAPGHLRGQRWRGVHHRRHGPLVAVPPRRREHS